MGPVSLLDQLFNWGPRRAGTFIRPRGKKFQVRWRDPDGTQRYKTCPDRRTAKQLIREIERVSKPGRRVYSPVKNIPTVANGLGVAILSTPKGVMSDSKAREANVGGEIICNVF